MDMTWQMTAIINTANELQRYGSTGASTGEHIAAAFVLQAAPIVLTYGNGSHGTEQEGASSSAQPSNLKTAR